MLDEITRAVLSREEVSRYLDGTTGERGDDVRARIEAYVDELKTTQRYSIYKALKHPLYPILRKIDRIGEHVELVKNAGRGGRVVYASNHRSHCDYLVEPLVLDDNGVRPPIIAAGINLFGGPLGLLHRHVTGAIPDPAQHARPGVPDHAQGLRRRAAAQARLLLLSGRRAQLQRRAEEPQDRADAGGAAGRAPAHGAGADGGVLRPGARGSHPGAAGREADAAAVQPRARRDGALRGGLPLARVRHLRPADSARRRRCGIAPRRARPEPHGDEDDRAALQGAAAVAHRRGDAPVDHAARARGARRRDPRHAARLRAPTSACRAAPKPPIAPSSRSKRAASSPWRAGRVRVRERNVLRYYARGLDHLLASPSRHTH